MTTSLGSTLSWNQAGWLGELPRSWSGWSRIRSGPYSVRLCPSQMSSMVTSSLSTLLRRKSLVNLVSFCLSVFMSLCLLCLFGSQSIFCTAVSIANVLYGHFVFVNPVAKKSSANRVIFLSFCLLVFFVFKSFCLFISLSF